MARTAAFVMPEVKPGPFDLFVKLDGRDQLLLFQGSHDFLPRLGELLVVVHDEVVVLLVERIDVVLRVTVAANDKTSFDCRSGMYAPGSAVLLVEAGSTSPTTPITRRFPDPENNLAPTGSRSGT